MPKGGRKSTTTRYKSKYVRRTPYAYQNWEANPKYIPRGRYPTPTRDERIYNRVFTVEQLQTVTFAGGPVLQSYNFHLNQAAGQQSYQGVLNLFSQYRFSKVEVEIIPTWNIISNAGVGADTDPVRSAILYDVNPISSLADIQTKNTYMETRFDKNHKRVIYPKLLRPVFNVAGVSPSEFTVSEPDWLTMRAPATEHFGLGVYFPAPAAAATNIWNVKFKFFVDFKNTL